MSTHDRVAPLVVIAPSAGKTGPVPTSVASPHHRRGRARPPESVDARSLEDVVTDLARLTAQVRQMSSANHALRGANQTLTDANTGLRHDRADAQAETAHAHAETVDAQAETAHAHAETVDAQTDTADIRTRNVALQATNDAMDSRNADLEATVAEVERANGALQAHRVGVQELAAVLEAERAQFAVILAGLEDAVLVMDHTGTPLRMNAAYVHLFGDAVLAPDDARGRPLAPDQTPQARAARGETFSLSFSLATGVPSLTGSVRTQNTRPLSASCLRLALHYATTNRGNSLVFRADLKEVSSLLTAVLSAQGVVFRVLTFPVTIQRAVHGPAHLVDQGFYA